MKRIKFSGSAILCACVALIISVAACTKAIEEPAPEALPETDLALIEALGYSTRGITESDGYYVVEGNILLDKSGLAGYGDGRTTRSYYYGENYKVSATNVKNIKVFLNSYYLPSSLVQSYQRAVNEWNNVTYCPVKFVVVSGSFEADIQINPSFDNSIAANIPIAAEIPSGGQAGKYIRVNLSYERIDEMTADKWFGTLVSGLGQAIGFAHMNDTNPRAVMMFPSNGAYNMSFMDIGKRPFYSMSPWTGFSNNDIQNILWLYPDPNVNVTWGQVSANITAGNPFDVEPRINYGTVPLKSVTVTTLDKQPVSGVTYRQPYPGNLFIYRITIPNPGTYYVAAEFETGFYWRQVTVR